MHKNEANTTASSSAASTARYHAVRLLPGDDIIASLRAFVDRHGLVAAAMVTCVGSLSRVRLRFANVEGWATLSGPFEILSLVGTIDQDSEHLHISIADSAGRCLGGHLGSGSTVYTTAEMVLAELTDLKFKRVPCALSGYDELLVESRAAGKKEEERA